MALKLNIVIDPGAQNRTVEQAVKNALPLIEAAFGGKGVTILEAQAGWENPDSKQEAEGMTIFRERDFGEKLKETRFEEITAELRREGKFPKNL